MFKQTDPEHVEFAPVKDWVVTGPGKFVIGGTKYREELFAVKTMLPFLAELERRGKIVRCMDVAVDAEEEIVKIIEPANDFDDPHLVALIRLSGCKLVCIRDPRSHRFLRDVRLYNANGDRPSLYTRAKNRSLLKPANIAPCCR